MVLDLFFMLKYINQLTFYCYIVYNNILHIYDTFVPAGAKKNGI